MEPEDYELGEDVTHVVRRSTRPHGIVVSVRLAAEDAAILTALARESGKTTSQLAREALGAFLSNQLPVARPAPSISGKPGSDLRVRDIDHALQTYGPVSSFTTAA